MTYYIIRKGTHENHGNNIHLFRGWIEDEEGVIRAHFNELVEKENITWQLVRVDMANDVAKCFTKKTIVQSMRL